MPKSSVACFLFVTAAVLGGCPTKFVPPKPYEASVALKGRSRLTGFTAYHSAPETLVGRTITVKKDGDKCPNVTGTFHSWTLSRVQYLKRGAKPKAKQKVRVVYEKRLEGKLDTSSTFPFVSVNADAKGAVELIVTDVAEVLGTQYLSNKKIEAIEADDWPTEVCARFIVENVVSSVAHYKTHTKVASRTEVVGTAFGLGAKVYNANSEFKPELLIFLDVLPLTPKKADGADKRLGLEIPPDFAAFFSAGERGPDVLLDDIESTPEDVVEPESKPD